MNKLSYKLCDIDSMPPDIVSQETLEKVFEIFAGGADGLADLLKVLCNPIRLNTLRALEVGDLCVCVLVHMSGFQHSLLSYHLNLLKDNGLIESRREGNFQIYGLTRRGRKIVKILELLELEVE